ncbi:uncharacterized protein LOC132043068 [Lycium ferocissimum]|uniref:uncharacterized protein LOC132043068 n=1 Tax=Lycium ferocissimum TaxID=112874 RepID=UPI002816830E|nr:uncharacterized protein LOC132043068 [Lycium ferocissimum]
MLRVCAIDFSGYWDQFLLLAEIAYNNSYNSSIDMAPFVALYDRRCRSPVLLKISPMKSVIRLGKRGKLSPRYIGPFEIIDRVGNVTYELALPPGLAGVNQAFYISMLKKHHADGTYICHCDSILLDENLTYEEVPIVILDRQVQKLRSKEIPSLKVKWKHRPIEEATWETEFDMHSRYP